MLSSFFFSFSQNVNFFLQSNFCLVNWLIRQARDEEKNRRNNKDSTNQVMKDLEDLLPDKSLIPPPAEEEPLSGTLTFCKLYMCAIPLYHFFPTQPSSPFIYFPSVFSDIATEKSSKSTKMKPGTAGKDVNLQKEVSLAAPNPRRPVTRGPGPRGGPPGNPRGPQSGPGRGRGRGAPPRR